MRVEAFLAEHAAVGADDMITAMGIGFDSIAAPVFPARHTRMALVLRLVLSPSECGQAHTLRIDLLDPDGVELLRQEQGFALARATSESYRPRVMPVVWHIDNLVFPAPGDYAFHVLVDTLELAVVPLYVRYRSPTQETP